MTYKEYKALFEEIIKSENPPAPYDNEDYMTYTKVNLARMKRWDKTMALDTELVASLQELSEPQHWIIIVEPWCGDAAHLLPFLIRLAQTSPEITYELQLRDSEPFLINSYLTNGGKSIPKLIARDGQGNDLFTWGPRPEGAQRLMEELKATNADFEMVKMELQRWYNENKGKELFEELLGILKPVV